MLINSGVIVRLVLLTVYQLLVLRPKLVLHLTDVLQSCLSASVSVCHAWKTQCLLFFRATGSHVVRATIQHDLTIRLSTVCIPFQRSLFSLCLILIILGLEGINNDLFFFKKSQEDQSGMQTFDKPGRCNVLLTMGKSTRSLILNMTVTDYIMSLNSVSLTLELLHEKVSVLMLYIEPLDKQWKTRRYINI